MKDTNELLEKIARDHLDIETLAEQKADDLDFHDISVWNLKKALQAAYDAGQQANAS